MTDEWVFSEMTDEERARLKEVLDAMPTSENESLKTEIPIMWPTYPMPDLPDDESRKKSLEEVRKLFADYKPRPCILPILPENFRALIEAIRREADKEDPLE